MQALFKDQITIADTSKILKLENIAFQNLPFHLYIKNEKGIILDCNLEQARSLGCKKNDDIIGSNGFDWLVAKDAEEIEINDSEVIATKTKKIVYENARNENKDFCGTIGCKLPLTNQLGKIIGLFGISFVFSRTATLDPLHNLSNQQKECLFYLAKGMSYKKIASHLHISPRTVENYINYIKDKLSCVTRAELTEKAWNSYFMFHRLQIEWLNSMTSFATK